MSIDKAVISGNIQEQVYAALKSDIINGELAFGTQLKEMELASAFGISRSPVREALRRLCGDGLLELRPNCGIYVREFSMKYVSDLLDMRCMMESHGMAQVLANCLTDAECKELERLRGFIQRAIREGDALSLEEHMELDAKLHSFFNSLNRNEIMDEMWDRMALVNVVVQRLSLKERGMQSHEEHLQVVDYLLEGKVERAIETNKRHLEHTKLFVEKALCGR